MTQIIRSQGEMFLASLIMGIGMGITYDVLRSIRKNIRHFPRNLFIMPYILLYCRPIRKYLLEIKVDKLLRCTAMQLVNDDKSGKAHIDKPPERQLPLRHLLRDVVL